MAAFLQFLASGLTIGATYALSALGYSLIYNAAGVINFAQGEFIMIGGIVAASLVTAGVDLPLAILIAILTSCLAAALIERLAIEPAGEADAVTLIIITLGASVFLRGVVQVTLGKSAHSLPSFSGDQPLALWGATILPQSLWVMGVTVLLVLGLFWFFGHTMVGKAMLAMGYNRLAAQLIGVNRRAMLLLSFVLAAALGAAGGVLLTPIAFMSYDSGVMFGLKGFVAAILGGLGGAGGAVMGGLILGLAESFTAGYVSSSYKDAAAFVLIIVILCFMPRGLFPAKVIERV
ncbi:MAG: branched-chain amino acid ABC transporter permease [Candidatus Symbiobacter sp.]|nr:branched-chain amino acid ABC transporter permease [Candidatus Symbiobacter sp.]